MTKNISHIDEVMNKFRDEEYYISKEFYPFRQEVRHLLLSSLLRIRQETLREVRDKAEGMKIKYPPVDTSSYINSETDAFNSALDSLIKSLTEE